MIILNKDYPLPIRVNYEFDPSLQSHKPWPEYKFDDTYATDFLVPEGTKVFSVCSGTIIRMSLSSNIGGDDFKFAGRDNKIYIKDDNSKLIFAYRHLAYRTPAQIESFIKKSDGHITEGQYIGEISMTGWTDTPHLHFVAYNHIEPDFFQSIKIIL